MENINKKIINYTKKQRILSKANKQENDYKYLYSVFRDFKLHKLPDSYLGKVAFSFTKVAWQMQNIKYLLKQENYIEEY